MINDKMKIIAEQQSQRVVLKGNTIKDGNTIYSVKSPFTFKREIEYNNLSNVTDFSNSQTDTRVNDTFSFTIYDFTNGYTLGGESIMSNGFKSYLFTCNITSNNINFYHSGSAINIYILEYASLVGGHKYWCSFDCISHDSRVVGGLHLKNFVVIDLTQLYGAGNEPTTKEQFFATELGQAIRNGTWLPYSLANTKGNAITPTTYIRTKRVDLGTLNYNSNSGTFPTNILYSLTAINDISTLATALLNCGSDKISSIRVNTSKQVIITTTENYESATEFKTAMSGTILEYETAEPLELNGIGTNYDTFSNHDGKVVRKIIKTKINDLNWSKVGSEFRVTITPIKPHSGSANTPEIICSGYPVVSPILITLNNQVMSQNDKVITIKDNRYSSVAELKSAQGNEYIYYITTIPETETERSVLVDNRYNKVVDSNGNEIDTE